MFNEVGDVDEASIDDDKHDDDERLDEATDNIDDELSSLFPIAFSIFIASPSGMDK